jgi:hypothetical protein
MESAESCHIMGQSCQESNQPVAQEEQCAVLDENGSHRAIGSGATRRCGLVRVGVALLEEVCHWGWTLRFQKLEPDASLYHY